MENQATKAPLLSDDAEKIATPVAAKPAKERLVAFGVVDLTEWPENTQAIVLAGGALLSSLGFAYLQEKLVLCPLRGNLG